MRTLFNPRPSPGGRSACAEPTSIYREARPPTLICMRSARRVGLLGGFRHVVGGSVPAEALPPRDGGRPSPDPSSGPESRGPAPGPSRSRGAGRPLPAEKGKTGNAPVAPRRCWRLRGEAKTWRPPKSVGVAGGLAGRSGSFPGGGRAGRPAGAPPSPGRFPSRRRCSFPRRGRRAEQAALDHQEHGQAGPGDRGAAPRPGPAGGGQGDPAGPAGQGADPEGPGHGKRPRGRARVRRERPPPPLIPRASARLSLCRKSTRSPRSSPTTSAGGPSPTTRCWARSRGPSVSPSLLASGQPGCDPNARFVPVSAPARLPPVVGQRLPRASP